MPKNIANAAGLVALAALTLSMAAPAAKADTIPSLNYGGARASTCAGICRGEPSGPHIVHVPQPESAEARALAEARDRRWIERCRPVIRQDEYGVPRYTYAARGCEYGRID